MLRAPTSFTLALFCCACQMPGQYGTPYAMSETPVSEAVSGRPTWGRPLELLGTPSRILPYAREHQLTWFSDRDTFSEGGHAARGSGYESSYYLGTGLDQAEQRRRTRTERLRWHNGVVVDLSGGAQWPLLEERGVLSRYWVRIDRGEDGRGGVTALLFAATVEDTNGDGKLDDRDAARALQVDADGRDPRFVTPAGTQLREVLFDSELDVAILMLASDDDGDGVFSADEAVDPYLLELDGGGLRPLISPEALQAVEATLDAP